MKSQISNPCLAGRQIKSQKNGFALLETLVALSVLALAITGPLTLASYAIRSASYSQNQSTAFYLGQEALEYIKNRRDNNALAGAAEWLDGLGFCRGATGCVVDIPNNNIINCPANNPCPKINYDSATGFYNYSTGSETPFIREVKLRDVVGGREAKVSVIITWQEKFGSRSFTIEENILNWP
jgi:prepilin-type N-terminal cleavage/methylation domain-containing protein